MDFAASGETLFKTRCGAKDFFDSLKRHGGAFSGDLRPRRRRCPGRFAPIFNVSPKGDPLEIYTDRDGEVIFKKYSPMGELGTFVGELAEALSRTSRFVLRDLRPRCSHCRGRRRQEGYL